MSNLRHRPLRLTIGLRFGLALGASVVVAVAATTFSNLLLSTRMTEQAAERELQVLQGLLSQGIEADAERALSLADSLAGNAAIQEQFANRDREALSQMLEQGYKQLKSEHGVVQLQFHTAPAISFLRLHRPEKFGDDLSAIRKTVVEVNASGKPVTGLEYGVEGLGIRGVTPVKKDGKQIGSVEIGMSFGDRFFEAFKRGTGADVALHLATPWGFELLRPSQPPPH